MDLSVLAALSLGFWHGLRHAFDADHLVAVSTIVSEHKSIARSSLVGTFWGLGHTASLFAIGLLVILLRGSIPDRAALWMEMPVAAMLILLGANVVLQVVRERGLRLHAHTHDHDGQPPHHHIHLHARDEHDHRHRLLHLGRRPFLVGLVHGVAGSAVLTLAVLTTIPSITLGLAFIAVFGLGSVGGMLMMSAMIAIPFAATAQRFTTINVVIRTVAGVLSVLFGLMLAWGLVKEISQVT